MADLKRLTFMVIALLYPFAAGLSQNVNISNISNHYLKVISVAIDRVSIVETTPGELSNFLPGDKILVIQMTGITLDDSPGFLTDGERRIKKEKKNTGRFEVLQLDEVLISATDTVVVFTDSLSNIYDAGEKIQLVKFVEGENVTVTSEVTARAWNGSTGGIVAILGLDTVKLSSNINVNYQGFRGGSMPDEIYNDVCRYDVDANTSDTLYLLPTRTGISGNKGEGIVTATWPYTKGTGFNFSGGGSGNGRYSGGGGGGNFWEGGDGGEQSVLCTDPFSVKGGWGGGGSFELYRDPTTHRIVMGGGGGSGTRRSSATLSPGGNGGGIVIIITGTLVGNGGSITANGQSAASTTGSGGGGGAGGTVLIDAGDVTGTAISISVRGGNGGSTTNSTASCTGSGGGGSGGVIWHSGATISAVVDTTRGQNGSASSCFPQSGIRGNYGTKLENLIMPLNGFLFNAIRGTDTICASQVPNELTASQPKGGDGEYDYDWQQSTDNKITWVTAAGGTNVSLRTFQPPALSQSIWYRRIVTSDTITDISREIQVYVYPAIGDNRITGEDTLCYNMDAKPVQGLMTTPTGGNGSYSYVWENSPDLGDWDTVGFDAAFDPGALTGSVYFRRRVNSTAYCHHTSDTVLITVLPSIIDNGFSGENDTAICMNTSPGTLYTLMPGGGDLSYTYSWQYKTRSINWTDIPDSNSMVLNVGSLTDTTAYRRIVYSGNDDACIDTGSVPKNVIIRLPISTNHILQDPVRYTCYNSPIQLQGSIPLQGFSESNYAYQWEQRIDNNSWESVTAIGEAYQHYQSGSLTDTTYFRRIVLSSPALHECADTSDAVEVRINPLPEGNVFDSQEILCAGETLYVKFNLSGNGPFNIALRGAELNELSKSGISGLVDSVAFVPYETQAFIMVSVEDDSGCFANPSNFEWVTPATVYEVPTASAGFDSDVCGDTFILQASNSVSGSTGLWTATGASFADATSNQSSVTVDSYGPAVFKWTLTNWQCTDEDEVVVTFYEQPEATDAGTDQILEFNYTTQLQAVPASVGTGKWSVTSGTGEFDNDVLPDAVISELSNNTTLRWTVTNGNCAAVTDSMKILINPLSIPKGFTPDGNGTNDYFNIGADHAENIKIKVFNSSGVLVFETDQYDNDEKSRWYGENMNGVKLPEGTYYYIVNIKVVGRQQEVQFRSFVEIMR